MYTLKKFWEDQQIYSISLYPLKGKDRGLPPQRGWRGHEECQTIGLLYGRCFRTETQASKNEQRQDYWPDFDIAELRRLCQCDEDQGQFFHLGIGLEVQAARPFWEWASALMTSSSNLSTWFDDLWVLTCYLLKIYITWDISWMNPISMRLDTSNAQVKIVTPIRPVICLAHPVDCDQGAVRLM